MPRSVLTAIADGNWNFEPADVQEEAFDSTAAMPGSEEKLKLMAQRLGDGLPLWHPDDRQSYGEKDTAFE